MTDVGPGAFDAGLPPPAERPKTDYLFELEVWLKAIDCFFLVENLPLSADQRAQAALRNYAAELGAIRGGLIHVAALATEMLGEERRDLAPFLVFLDEQRSTDHPETHHRGVTPEQDMAFAIEKIHDLIRIFDEIGRSAFIPLQTFRSVGRVVVDVLRKDAGLAVFFSETLKPSLDRSNKRNLQKVAERVAGTRHRREIIGLLMELFRQLRTVELARTCFDRPDEAKKAVLVFALVRSGTERFCVHLRKKVTPTLPPGSSFAESLERLVFSTGMEIRKVHEMILVDLLLLTDPRSVISRLEDSQGILKDLFQQNILQLAATFTDGIEGRDLFPDYVTKAEQSLQLRNDLWNLVVRCGKFQEREDRYSLADLLGALDHFKRGSMRFLMFKDWSNFERYLNEFTRDASMASLVRLAHQFDVYVRTLIREVSKRSVLSAVPFKTAPSSGASEAETQKIRKPS